jgi:hypothetical protein
MAHVATEQEVVLAKVFEHPRGRARPLKGGKESPKSFLYLLIRAQAGLGGQIVNRSDGRAILSLPRRA